jgi:hypothetical protein
MLVRLRGDNAVLASPSATRLKKEKNKETKKFLTWKIFSDMIDKSSACFINGVFGAEAQGTVDRGAFIRGSRNQIPTRGELI